MGSIAQLPLPALLLPLLAPPAPADVLTVDDDGLTGTFTEIQTAIDEAAPGDVILVDAGTYQAIVVDLPLAILARSGAGPVHVVGHSRVSGVATVRLAGLKFDVLRIVGVSDSAVVESCQFGQLPPYGVSNPNVASPLRVVDCANVLLTHVTAQGDSGCCGDSPWPSGQAYGAGAAGARFESSRAIIVDSSLRGGGGKSGCDWNTGGSGLEVRAGSHVTVVGSTVRGGGGGAFECISYGDGDPGGDGLWIVESTVVLRGAGLFETLPGYSSPIDGLTGGGGGWITSPDGYGLRGGPGSIVFSSGTSLGSVSLGGAGQILPAAPEPFLEVQGSVLGGQAVQLDVRAPVGVPLVLAWSFLLDPFKYIGWDGAIWISPFAFGGAIVVAGAGQGTAATTQLLLPGDLAALAGLELGFQIFAPTVPGTQNPDSAFVGNPVTVLLR